MSDAQPQPVADTPAPDVYTVSFAFIEQGVPVQNDQRGSWWGSYGYRAQHRKAE